MAVSFQNVRFAPFDGLTLDAPDGCIIGLIGEKGCGDSALLKLAADLEHPESGEVHGPETRRYFGVSSTLSLAPAGLLLIDHALEQADALVRARAVVAMDRLRAGGSTILIACHDENLLLSICDEVWWFDSGKLAHRGHPGDSLARYRQHTTAKFLAWGQTLSMPLSPSLRKGNGQAEIVNLEILNAGGKASAVLQSGQDATIRLTVRFVEDTERPVAGIMIRTRIGLEVYGTNTDLEKLAFGPCKAGETVRIEFRFRCDLCPKEYTLTAASHAPDGTAYDWLEDALAFVVSDDRYTAGVANLRAQVTAERS